ncbi:ABC transporter permease [Streptomyces sp. NPDC047315]|uniref:ABC transporter permease n=1 Tax=Streptomyces sp. NPDC047315 TaxID=3155142 RepID=UPI0033CB58A0
MSSLTYVVPDAWTMLRRNLKHLLRYPIMMIVYVGQPIFVLLMFVGVYGNALGASAPGTDYIEFAAPGVILITVNFGCTTTAFNVSTDMTSGIVSRFRTMSISRAAILGGHVLESLIRTMASVLVVVVACLLLGYRSSGGILGWVAALALVALLSFAVTWLVVALTLAAKTLQQATSNTLIFQFLPFFSSAFVPTDTMPAVVSWIARYQPLTPIIETIRELLAGTSVGTSGLAALAWCVGIGVVGFLWSIRLFGRDAVPAGAH